MIAVNRNGHRHRKHSGSSKKGPDHDFPVFESLLSRSAMGFLEPSIVRGDSRKKNKSFLSTACLQGSLAPEGPDHIHPFRKGDRVDGDTQRLG